MWNGRGIHVGILHEFPKVIFQDGIYTLSMSKSCGKEKKSIKIHANILQELPKVRFRDRIVLLNLIKSCGKDKNMCKAREIHSEMLKKDLISKDIYVATALLTTYAKCGALKEAQEVFHQIPMRDVVSWNAMMTGYVEYGWGHEALVCFQQMQRDGISPDSVSYTCILKACGIGKFLEIGRDIDVEIRKKGLLQKDIMLANILLDMYAKCGDLKKAREVFDHLPVQSVVSWTALMDGYTQHGLADEALKCFKQMQDEGIFPNIVTYICILKACGIVRSLEIGKDIDSEVRKQGLLQKGIVLGTALIDMYAKCGAIDKAREVFEQLPKRDVVAWNTLIAGYDQYGLSDKALECFWQMQDEGICPNAVTYIYSLKACAILQSLEVGEHIDAEVRKQDLLQKDIVLGTTLIDMYAKCGMVNKAREIFEQLPMKDTVMWTTLIGGYAQHGFGEEALECFKKMQEEGFHPDAVTYMCILKICGILGYLQVGEDIDAHVRQKGLLQRDIILCNTLIDMYAKCGALEKSREVFEQLIVRDVVSWNTLIIGYAQHERIEETLECFKQMQDDGITPDEVTYICILKACGIVGSLEIGKEIDAKIGEQGLLEKYVMLGNALIDMYAKCGELKKAREVLEQLPLRDVVSWNALMAGYAQLGQASVVLDLFRRMRNEVMPDPVTFLILLTSCSHAGLMEEGEKLFDDMHDVYHLDPTLKHYSCMVDLFGRAGHFDKAQMLLDKMPYSDHLPLFLSVLGACRKWLNVKLGRWAFEQSIKLDEKCVVAYVCMENIYAAAGMQEKAREIEAWKVKNNAWSVPLSTDANMNVYSFEVAIENHMYKLHTNDKL